MVKKIIHVWTDGSYNKELKIYASAFYVENNNTAGVEVAKDEYGGRNVSGECFAVIKAIDYCIDTFGKDIIIVINHDFIGLSNWYYHEWEGRSEISHKYLDALKSRPPETDLIFNKVKAHSGERFNNLVDALCTDALKEKK